MFLVKIIEKFELRKPTSELLNTQIFSTVPFLGSFHLKATVLFGIAVTNTVIISRTMA